MSSILKMSKLYCPTLKEIPNDADIESHKLLLRAGMIRKTASGVYIFLPLGLRVLQKIENIIREEMAKIGAQEIMMPALQPSELWHESGRWDDYGPELMRLEDRHSHMFCLGPTHEELITSLIRDELNSYKQLPCTLYQIQTKFRDEIRPRFGLLRSREFVMKDAYSFHSTQESLQQTYDDMSEAYGTICDRCELEWRGVEADSGQIGGKVTTEFMALANSGEAELVHCKCGFAANVEAAQCIARPEQYDGGCELQKIATPNVHTIEELAHFLNISDKACAKALSCKSNSGDVFVLFVPGDHEVNEIKAARIVEGFEILNDEEMQALSLHKGSMGPVNLPDGIKIIADRSLKDLKSWVVGANEDGYHMTGAVAGRDFEVSQWAEICTTKPGDVCPNCGEALSGDRGIEVSQVFQLGTKYSESLNAKYLDENGKQQPFVMGCYGIGVSRTLAAIVEQHNDENGIIWPISIAPAHICILALGEDDEILNKGFEVAEICEKCGFEVVVDDRSLRPGPKFADADLIGWPLQIIIGKRSIESGEIEIKLRGDEKKASIAYADFCKLLDCTKLKQSNKTSARECFDCLF